MTKSESLPTYAEIAGRANVSIKTVCNVFRAPSIVRSKTMNKVLLALKELGVEDPNAMVLKLRPARITQERSLLFLVSVSDTMWLGTPIFAKLIQAAEQRAHEKEWQLQLRHQRSADDLAQTLKNFRGRGVLLFGMSVRCSELWTVLPGVAAVRLLAAPHGGMDCDAVDFDRGEVARLAAAFLKEQGCRKVAYLGPSDSSRGREFCDAANGMGLSAIEGIHDSLYVSTGTSQAVNREGLIAAWETISEGKPDGIFVHSDHVANALFLLLEKQGITPGPDFPIISCNADEIFLSPLHPCPATIDLHPAEIGRRGIDQLLDRIENSELPPSQIIIRPRLVFEESTQPS